MTLRSSNDQHTAGINPCPSWSVTLWVAYVLWKVLTIKSWNYVERRPRSTIEVQSYQLFQVESRRGV